MQHGNERLIRAMTKARLESFDGLRRKGNFGHKNYAALALRQRMIATSRAWYRGASSCL